MAARASEALDETVAALPGDGHMACAVDLLAANAADALCNQVEGALGSPEIVVHNLGGALGIKDPLCSAADWERLFQFNLGTGVGINRRLIPAMVEAGWGRVVHVSSVAGSENLGPAPYCALKAALNAYVRSMGRIYAKHGLVVCGVAPGAVVAPGNSWDQAQQDDPERVARYLREQTPLGRFATPEEIAPLVTFLCSEHGAQCAGSVLAIDGGLGRSFDGLGISAESLLLGCNNPSSIMRPLRADPTDQP